MSERRAKQGHGYRSCREQCEPGVQQIHYNKYLVMLRRSSMQPHSGSARDADAATGSLCVNLTASLLNLWVMHLLLCMFH